MLQDIAPYQYDNSYRETAPEADSFLIFSERRTALADLRSGEIRLPLYGDLQPDPETLTYLFTISGRMFFLCEAAVPQALTDAGFDFLPARQLQGSAPQWLGFAAVTAIQLANWYHNNRFCGCCGGPTTKDHRERMLYCSSCRNMIYPRINPAVIVGVTHKDRILLTKYAGREGVPNYALIAGFAEIGEPLEDTVRREVMEEVGLKVKNIRYYKSQPWMLSDTLLSGFYCDLDGDDETVTLDMNELSVGIWAERSEIPARDLTSLTATMMDTFRRGEEPR